MTVTVIFNNNNSKTDQGQAWNNVKSWTTHNTYRFLELVLGDGSSLFLNLDRILSFQVIPSTPETK